MTDVNFDKLKIIFIDWYLTLTSVTFLNKLKTEHHDIFKKFIEVIFEKNQNGWQYDWARGKLNKENAAAEIEKAGIMPHEKVLQTFADCCANQTLDYPEVLNLISKIRKQGIKVVLATDNWDVFCDYTIPSLNLEHYFDDILSSNQVGFLKRDVKDGIMLFFADYLQKNNIKKEQAVLVDDAKINIDTCQKCHFPAIQTTNCFDTLSILQNILEQKCKKN